MLRTFIVCCALGAAPVAWADDLTFMDAVDRASADGPTIDAGRSALEAAQLRVGPADELPDPKLVLGVRNIPVSGADQFALDRDFMTRTEVGVMQEVPNRAKRSARTGKAEASARAANAALDVARLEARLGAARGWIEVYYGYERLSALDGLASELQTLAQSAEDGLANAVGTADEALDARIALSRIDDRKASVEAAILASRAELERWIGETGSVRPGPAAPSFAIDPERMRRHVEHHVAVSTALAQMRLAEADLNLARADRRSDWSWDVMYGRREPAFSDMVSVGVTFSLPLFQSSRQAPRIEASRADLRRAQAQREAVLRQHRAHLEAMLADHAALKDQLARLKDVQLPLMRQRAKLAEASLSAGDRSIAAAIEARLDVLEMELDRIALEQQFTQLGAMLTLEHAEGMQ